MSEKTIHSVLCGVFAFIFVFGPMLALKAFGFDPDSWIAACVVLIVARHLESETEKTP